MHLSATLTPEQRREHDFLRYRESLLIDEQTWVAENLDAPLEKPLSYRYHDDELWSEQGQALGSIFKDSIDHYDALARQQPELAFQARRSRAEYGEYEAMKAMARGEAPNTLVVVSPYPRELEGATKDTLGYQAMRRLGFIRVLTHESDGLIKMWTHSIDQSDAAGIDNIYRSMGRTVDWGLDVLEQPVQLDIPETADRQLLGEQLLAAYDMALTRRCGGNWFAGRNSEVERREAVAFVMSQRDLLETHVDALIHVGPKSELADQLRYDFAAAMRRRFKGDTRHQDAADGSVAAEMATAGREAAELGEEASGCGLTIEAGQVAQSTAAQLAEAGYKLPRQGERLYDECMTCPECRGMGVWVERSEDGKIDYTCDSPGGCGASTKVSAGPSVSSQSKEVRASRNEATMAPRRPPKAPLLGQYRRTTQRKRPRKAQTARKEITIGGERLLVD